MRKSLAAAPAAHGAAAAPARATGMAPVPFDPGSPRRHVWRGGAG